MVFLGVVGLVWIGALVFVLLTESFEWFLRIQQTGPLAMLALYISVLTLVSPKTNAKQQYATHTYLRETTTYFFTDNGVETRCESLRSTMKWNTIREVHETRTLFLVHYGPTIAIIIPKRFFRNPDLIDVWRQDVIRNMGKPIISNGLAAKFC